MRRHNVASLCSMRQLAEIEQQIDTNFRRRLADVVASHYPEHGPLSRSESLDLFSLLSSLNDLAPGVAIRFGLARTILDLGLLGYTVLSCRNVAQALDVIYRYHALTSAEYQVRLIEERGTTVLRPLVRPAAWEHRVVIAEEFVTGFWVVLTELLPANTERHRIEMGFDFPEPVYGPLYREAMPAKIEFDRDMTSLRFPSEWRPLPLQTADATVEAVCRAQCDELLESVSPSTGIVDDVRRLILAVPANRRPKLHEVADQLMVSPRTLERRLQSAGQTFRSIDSEVRMGLAAQYVALRTVSGKQIAAILGYSEPAAFYRAFKLWHGQTPSQYRAAQPSR